jgi:hypothetical protein
MRRLIAKHPNGLAGFKGDLTPNLEVNGGLGRFIGSSEYCEENGQKLQIEINAS